MPEFPGEGDLYDIATELHDSAGVLVTFGPGPLEPRPSATKSWARNDRTALTAELREDVRFQAGWPVTAEGAAFAVKVTLFELLALMPLADSKTFPGVAANSEVVNTGPFACGKWTPGKPLDTGTIQAQLRDVSIKGLWISATDLGACRWARQDWAAHRSRPPSTPPTPPTRTTCSW